MLANYAYKKDTNKSNFFFFLNEMGEIVRLPVKNSRKELNNQTHCGFKYYRQSFHQSLGEILTEFPENQLNKMLMNVLLQSPAKIK